MKSNATYFKHTQPTSWSQGMSFVAGMKRFANGCNAGAIPSQQCRLGGGIHPMAAGR